MRRRPRRQISPERKSMHTLGLAMQILGGIGFFVCFIGFATAGMASVKDMSGPDSVLPFWVGAVVCMLLIGGGGALRSIAARGVAGSGLVLDPERARDELEPWARMGGRLVDDALDETRLGRSDAEPEGGEPPEAREHARVVVRCINCRTINDEDAKFCDECGAPL